MAIDSQLLAGTACVAVICLAFAVTSKTDDLIDAGSDDGPTAEDVAEKMTRLLDLKRYWLEHESEMSLREANEHLRSVRLENTSAQRVYQYYSGDASAAQSEYDKEYALFKNIMEQRVREMENVVQADVDLEEVPVNLGNIKETNIPKPTGVSFEQASASMEIEALYTGPPTFQTTPSDLDNAVDLYANVQESVLTTNERTKSAFNQAPDKLNRSENRSDDPVGGQRAAEEVESGIGIPTVNQVEKVIVEEVPEPTKLIKNAREGDQGLNDAPTFESVDDPPPSKPEIIDAIESSEALYGADDTILAKANVLKSSVQEAGANFNSTGDVQFGAETIQTQLETIRRVILNSSDHSERTEMVEKLQQLQKQVQVRNDMKPAEWEVVKKVRSAMDHLYKYDALSVDQKYGKRVALYIKKVRDAQEELRAAGDFPNSAALHQVNLDAAIAATIAKRYKPAKRARNPDLPVLPEQFKRVLDVAVPPSPKRAKTVATDSNVAKERRAETGEPPAKKRKPVVAVV
jgi:hypothetical protein